MTKGIGLYLYYWLLIVERDYHILPHVLIIAVITCVFLIVALIIPKDYHLYSSIPFRQTANNQEIDTGIEGIGLLITYFLLG